MHSAYNELAIFLPLHVALCSVKKFHIQLFLIVNFIKTLNYCRYIVFTDCFVSMMVWSKLQHFAHNYVQP